VDLAVEHEHDHCHAPEATREQILERHDAVDVSHPQQTQGTDQQDANTGPEVAAVDGHYEHNYRRKRPQCRREAAVAPAKAGKPRLQREQDRAAEHQPGHEEREILVAGPDQQQCSNQPANSARDEEQPKPQSAYVAQLAACTPYGAWVGGEQGECARCVGDYGRNDQGQQRERYQPATAGKRVDQAGRHRAKKNRTCVSKRL
jgi:hypothetical protein